MQKYTKEAFVTSHVNLQNIRETKKMFKDAENFCMRKGFDALTALRTYLLADKSNPQLLEILHDDDLLKTLQSVDEKVVAQARLAEVLMRDILVVFGEWWTDEQVLLEVKTALKIGKPVFEIDLDIEIATEINTQNIAAKFSAQKPRLDLIEPQFLNEIGRVLAYGAKKYAEDSWKNVPGGLTAYYAACLRHLAAWADGEENDKESTLPHLAHAATNIMFLMYFARNKKQEEKNA